MRYYSTQMNLISDEAEALSRAILCYMSARIFPRDERAISLYLSSSAFSYSLFDSEAVFE